MGAADTLVRRVGCEDGSLSIYSPWPTVDVEVRAQGYRPLTLEGLSASRAVVLEEGIPVILELPPDLELPKPPLQLRVLLIPSALHRHTFEEGISLEDGTGGLLWYRWLEFHAPAFASNRRLETRLPGAGEYVVAWEVARESVEEPHTPQPVETTGPEQLLQITEEDAGRLIELGPEPDALRTAIEFWSTSR